jgi:hypothetical protein
MADTKRQKIFDAVVTRMKTIRTANGYQTEVGTTVAEWESRFDEGELPALSVCDLPDEVSKESKSSVGVTHRLRMQVRIFTSKGTKAKDLRKMIGDVVRAVGQDPSWGYLAMDTEPGSEGFVVPAEAMEIAGGAVEFTVVFTTATFDPF